MDERALRWDSPGRAAGGPGDAGAPAAPSGFAAEGGGGSLSIADRLQAIAIPEGAGAPTAAGATELVRSAAAGDEQAWAQLVDRFAGVVWAVARSHRLSAADAADVSQTTWLRLVEHLGRLEQPERVGAWLATTARRESLRVLRMGGRQVPTGAELDLEPAVDQSDVDAQLIVEERDRMLNEMVKRLPARCQVLLRFLSADSRLSYRQLSEALDMPIGSLGPTRGRCLEHLRRIASGEGLSVSDIDPGPARA